MHELSIASGIVESVLEFAETHHASRVVEVRVAIGELTCVAEEPLKFCYEAITKDTPLEGSTMTIEHMDATVHCPHCSYQGTPKYWDEDAGGPQVATLQCPTCGKAVEAVTGHECAIKGIKYVT